MRSSIFACELWMEQYLLEEKLGPLSARHLLLWRVPLKPAAVPGTEIPKWAGASAAACEAWLDLRAELCHAWAERDPKKSLGDKAFKVPQLAGIALGVGWSWKWINLFSCGSSHLQQGFPGDCWLAWHSFPEILRWKEKEVPWLHSLLSP